MLPGLGPAAAFSGSIRYSESRLTGISSVSPREVSVQVTSRAVPAGIVITNTPICRRGNEVRRLPLVHGARLDPVLRTDRDVHLFHVVAVEVSEGGRDAAVRQRIPALVDGGYALAAIVPDQATRPGGLRLEVGAVRKRAGGDG